MERTRMRDHGRGIVGNGGTCRHVMIEQAKQWARIVKRDVHALYRAGRDPRVPWYAKALALCVAGYALSPIDLIPDFIPVFGYLDDLIIVPLGIIAAVKLIPPEVMAEHRVAAAKISEKPVSRSGAIIIVLIWLASMALIGGFSIARFFRNLEVKRDALAGHTVGSDYA